jgi:Holliday junction resolvase RusA-like endonuclease
MMPIPKSMGKSDRMEAMNGSLKHVKKPDVDNLIKLYLDVLSGIAFEDDNCVSLGQAIKVYGQIPKVVIKLEETKPTLGVYETMCESVAES